MEVIIPAARVMGLNLGPRKCVVDADPDWR